MLVARGDDLALFVEAARLTGTEAVLDVGTAAGGAALALAPRAARVVGVDIVPDLLDQAAARNGSSGFATGVRHHGRGLLSASGGPGRP